MGINTYLLLAFVLAALVIVYLITKLRRVRTQISFIKDTTDDIKSGNLNRRILTRESDMTKQICYDINEIALNEMWVHSPPLGAQANFNRIEKHDTM